MPTAYTVSSVLLSFFITLFVLPYWIKRAREHRLVGKDMHKVDYREVAELGGLIVVFGAILGILSYVALHIFIYKNGVDLLFLLAAVVSILIAMIIGLVDDILGWKIGIRQYQKALLTLLIAVPIIVVNAGEHTMNVPFFGQIELGLLFPLLVVPIAIIGSSNGFNMIAGFNGLEAGMGIITLSTLGLLSYWSNASGAALIAACMVISLLAFYVFNKHPAIIFPGDTLTYSVGATIGIVAILGNIEKFALMIFSLYFVELILKSRGKFQKESFAKTLPDGTLQNQYKKFYSLTHVSVRLTNYFFGEAKEVSVVRLILLTQVLIASLTILYYVLTA